MIGSGIWKLANGEGWRIGRIGGEGNDEKLREELEK
ncbi:MAG: hypothetical protein ACJAVK_000790 [Akkermansiaceae bacterium]|jgi:hypothetical protein